MFMMEKVFHFDAPHEKYHCDAAIVWCFDSRFQLGFAKHLKRLGVSNSDPIKIAGGAGLLRPGMLADVTVFDPATIVDHATYTKPHQYATGVEYVLVNGRIVLQKGRHLGVRPGMILYGPGFTGSGAPHDR
jgi:hypothetical protein